MKDYDAFSEGTIREIANLEIKNKDESMVRLQKIILSNYSESLFETANKADNTNGKIIVLSEYFI